MSISLEKLQRLRHQAGQGATPRRVGIDTARDAFATADVPPPPPPHDPLPALRRMLGLREKALPRPPLHARDRALPGQEIAPGVLLLEQVLPFDDVPVHVDGTFARCDPMPTAGMLLFDTETTGLSGGTGTRAFMIGASDFVPGGLRVRQLLITHLSAEPAMLRAFAGWLGEDTRLVSYNGRCYDAPLLATRYRLARMGTPLAGIDHLDLLFPTRRRYRGVWENCRLATIERNALGIVREDDLPGSEAPGAWLQYLRGGDAGLLRRVLLHNFQDVVTLARLLVHLAEGPPDAGIDTLPGLRPEKRETD
ncbi:ribonuclease H-like domain-containing protein [Pseudoxanthomonas sp. SL93]|uniref:ribonuclease H-like domain-containing protein n=1 Tax=Pseudoxanthomonas sp. SL93 TaxID=2995142 RepID=UPI00226DB884|nr:ribonuclease H-like domain-containing protein [Pseudoxanthomonas sp. SL93]WAC63791.1 ribonuclease H-like domain-containing protein [Pseudoxanthomonas sp. SL93]